MQLIQNLRKAGMISTPNWMPDNIIYAVTGGSVSYGANSGNDSDIDMIGIVIPPKSIVFPHTVGHIKGFGHPPPNFENWQQHHVVSNKKEYDFSFHSVVKYFNLAIEGNPNALDILYVRLNLINHMTQSGLRIRDSRHLFLHKGVWAKFRGYSKSHLHRLQEKQVKANPKRQATIDKYGYCTKDGYQVVRLLCQVEQLLMTGDMDLTRDGEFYKSIRRGEMPMEDLIKWFESKDKELEKLYVNSTMLPNLPRYDEVHTLLLTTLEDHYGKIENLGTQHKFDTLMHELNQLMGRYQ